MTITFVVLALLTALATAVLTWQRATQLDRQSLSMGRGDNENGSGQWTFVLAGRAHRPPQDNTGRGHCGFDDVPILGDLSEPQASSAAFIEGAATARSKPAEVVNVFSLRAIVDTAYQPRFAVGDERHHLVDKWATRFMIL